MAALAKDSHVGVTHVGAVPLKDGRDELVAKTLAAFDISVEGNAATFPVSSFSAKNGTPQVARKDPTTGKVLAHVQNCTWDEADEALANCVAAQKKLSKMTGDQRVAFIEKLNVALEAKLADFSTLLTLEVGKVPTESRGEMVEVFDVVDVIRKRSAELGGDKPYFTRVYDSCDPKRRELGWKGNE